MAIHKFCSPSALAVCQVAFLCGDAGHALSHVVAQLLEPLTVSSQTCIALKLCVGGVQSLAGLCATGKRRKKC